MHNSLSWLKFYNADFVRTHTMRDQLNQENCHVTLINFIKLNEGCVLYPYLDSYGHWTIGYGLLLKYYNKNDFTVLAKNAFLQAIDINLSNFININDLKANKLCEQKKHLYCISINQSRKLLEYVLEKNRFAINNKIKFYKNLPLNQQIAVQSIWYHCPNLIGNSAFGNKFINLLQEKSLHSCLRCLRIIETNFMNVNRNRSFDARRMRESSMFSNRLIDLLIRIPDNLFVNFIKEFIKNGADFIDKIKNIPIYENNSFYSICDELLKNYNLNLSSLPNIEYIYKKMKFMHLK